jgi:hypothetical protein
VPTRTVELRGLVSRQTERGNATYRALSMLLDAQLAAGPMHPLAEERVPFFCFQDIEGDTGYRVAPLTASRLWASSVPSL